jgi:hypothetical protein
VCEAVEAWLGLHDGAQDRAENTLHAMSDDELDDACDTAASLLQALRAATLRPASEVRAEALREAAEVCRTVANERIGPAGKTAALMCVDSLRALAEETES